MNPNLCRFSSLASPGLLDSTSTSTSTPLDFNFDWVARFDFDFVGMLLHLLLLLLLFWNKSIEVRSSGRIGSGTTEIPFSVILKHPGDDNLERFYETFHGGNVSIQYLVTVDIVRGYLHKSLSATVEFIIESEKASLPDQPVSPELVIFYITQDTQRHSLLPELRSGGFRVTGKIGTQCSLSDPLKGELTVEASAVPIHSIDIHLLRVESILIADGDVCHNITLPIYIILPRLLTCPTIYAGPFSIEFKVSIVITFQSELLKLNPKSDPRMPRLWLAMESVPLELIRTNISVVWRRLLDKT
ncbi:hypothetical protein TEA_022497 [Camellia sinensis var. sinensis]|uniref:Down syndrome critical region protein 3 n=1 Tax=Camellia sinensis var. sinensis TaxID=542762 RepID=A0A4S4EPM5_CAMSN|nr:hypothetical protein TEA_022497 [Camellia sinensis var. sinensis]